MKLTFTLYHMQIVTEMVKNLNRKGGFGNDFLDTTPKAQAAKEKIDK